MSSSVALAEPIPRIPPRAFPAEFLGQAREWRRRFETSDAAATAVFGHILQPLIERARRHPVPRPEMLAKAAREYRQRMPEVGRLSLDIEHHKTRLLISDLHIGASDLQHEIWQRAEPGIALMRLEIEAAPRRCRTDLTYLACVSLHALARRLQRSFSVHDADITNDMRALIAAHALHQRIGTEFKVERPDGCWVGTVTEVATKRNRQRILNVRTFLTE